MSYNAISRLLKIEESPQGEKIVDIITIALQVLFVVVILLAVICIVRIVISLSVPKWKVSEEGLFWMMLALFIIAAVIIEILSAPPFLLKK